MCHLARLDLLFNIVDIRMSDEHIYLAHNKKFSSLDLLLVEWEKNSEHEAIAKQFQATLAYGRMRMGVTDLPGE